MEAGTERFVDGMLGEHRRSPPRNAVTFCSGTGWASGPISSPSWWTTSVTDVDLVIRGEDLLSSTGRQLRLGRLLGRERPPVFLHHPLINKPDGAKLSKASGDTGDSRIETGRGAFGHRAGPRRLAHRAVAGATGCRGKELAELFG